MTILRVVTMTTPTTTYEQLEDLRRRVRIHLKSLRKVTNARARTTPTTQPGATMTHLTRHGSTNAWRTLRAAILTRDNHTCQVNIPGICTQKATEVDHITPRIKGGTDNPTNLRGICHPCHDAIATHCPTCTCHTTTTPPTTPATTDPRWW